MSDQQKNRGRRRKDYVTFLAIGLFVFIVLLELMLVTWLPHQLMSEALWSREVAVAELVDLEDYLRTNIKHNIRVRNKWDEGESLMAIDSLNDIAKYLREYQGVMNAEQTRQLYLILKQFETRYNQWHEMRFCNNRETININPILEQTLNRYNNETNKKSEAEGNNCLIQK